jgi:uncharacterized alpha-E superfamily protein
VDFLLCDPDFPGSVRHCLDEASAVLTELPRSDASRAATSTALRSLLELVDAPLDQLHDGLDRLKGTIAALHDQVEATYFPPPLPSSVEMSNHSE